MDADGDRARYFNAACEVHIRRRQAALEGPDRLFHPFGVGHHVLTKLGELVAGWLTHHELTA
jgi:hypothetical protein